MSEKKPTSPADGDEVPRCRARTSSGRPCRNRPIRGGTVCSTHGGSAPQVVAAARRRLQERQAILAVETLGLPREVDPHTALLEELHRTAGAVQWLGAVVADLARDELVWGRTRESSGVDTGTTTWDAKPNAWVELWHRERKHLLEVSRTCIAAGIEERRVRIAEAAGQQLASVIRSVLDRLNLTDEQRSTALVVVPEEFRRLSEAGTG